jgi:hypothetical protein
MLCFRVLRQARRAVGFGGSPQSAGSSERADSADGGALRIGDDVICRQTLNGGARARALSLGAAAGADETAAAGVVGTGRSATSSASVLVTSSSNILSQVAGFLATQTQNYTDSGQQ